MWLEFSEQKYTGETGTLTTYETSKSPGIPEAYQETTKTCGAPSSAASNGPTVVLIDFLRVLQKPRGTSISCLVLWGTSGTISDAFGHASLVLGALHGRLTLPHLHRAEHPAPLLKKAFHPCSWSRQSGRRRAPAHGTVCCRQRRVPGKR